MNFLNVSGISRQEAKDFVLNDVSFTQQQFQKIAIAGETGSGKSTLLKIIAGLVQRTSGEVFFEQRKVKGPYEKLMPGHPGIVYLSQHFELLNNYRVEELLTFENRLTDEEAETLYQVCRISHLLKRRTDQLSGGEKQRIALAKLLLTSPKLLLLDEPFSNLDMLHKNILKEVIRDISERTGISCILVSHDPMDTLSWADEILVMRDGKILQQASPEQVYHQPVDEYTAGLFGRYNLISPARAKILFGLTRVETKGKNIFLRPEHFKIALAEKQGLRGTVDKLIFFGSAYEAEVLISENRITVRTGDDSIAKGDTVYVSLPPGKLWYI